MLGFENSQKNAAWLRPKIEQALIKRGFLEKPYLQGFRYVTPIRLQAGLTRHDFDAFARLLNAGRVRYGWSRMRKMPYAEFVAFVLETVNTMVPVSNVPNTAPLAGLITVVE